MIKVWQMDTKNKYRQLTVKEELCAHTQPITALATSTSYGIIVSGAEDHHVVIWDLTRLVFVRQLLTHPSSISHIVINHVTGDIVTCAGCCLFVWTVNGEMIAQHRTAERYGFIFYDYYLVLFVLA